MHIITLKMKELYILRKIFSIHIFRTTAEPSPKTTL
jgi:hypothetical protein